MKSLYSVDGPGTQLVDWLHKPSGRELRHSLVIGSRCSADLPVLGDQLADALNARLRPGTDRWQTFNIRDLWHLAGDPGHRTTILGNLPPDHHPGPPDSDIDRIARRLARLGGAILEGQYALDATEGLPNTFRVCLCSGLHHCPERCDILLKPEEFTTQSDLTQTIAAAFLKWRATHPVRNR